MRGHAEKERECECECGGRGVGMWGPEGGNVGGRVIVVGARDFVGEEGGCDVIFSGFSGLPGILLRQLRL